MIAIPLYFIVMNDIDFDPFADPIKPLKLFYAQLYV